MRRMHRVSATSVGDGTSSTSLSPTLLHRCCPVLLFTDPSSPPYDHAKRPKTRLCSCTYLTQSGLVSPGKQDIRIKHSRRNTINSYAQCKEIILQYVGSASVGSGDHPPIYPLLHTSYQVSRIKITQNECGSINFAKIRTRYQEGTSSHVEKPEKTTLCLLEQQLLYIPHLTRCLSHLTRVCQQTPYLSTFCRNARSTSLVSIFRSSESAF